jgi:hypothetical protein
VRFAPVTLRAIKLNAVPVFNSDELTQNALDGNAGDVIGHVAAALIHL